MADVFVSSRISRTGELGRSAIDDPWRVGTAVPVESSVASTTDTGGGGESLTGQRAESTAVDQSAQLPAAERPVVGSTSAGASPRKPHQPLLPPASMFQQQQAPTAAERERRAEGAQGGRPLRGGGAVAEPEQSAEMEAAAAEGKGPLAVSSLEERKEIAEREEPHQKSRISEKVARFFGATGKPRSRRSTKETEPPRQVVAREPARESARESASEPAREPAIEGIAGGSGQGARGRVSEGVGEERVLGETGMGVGFAGATSGDPAGATRGGAAGATSEGPVAPSTTPGAAAAASAIQQAVRAGKSEEQVTADAAAAAASEMGHGGKEELEEGGMGRKEVERRGSEEEILGAAAGAGTPTEERGVGLAGRLGGTEAGTEGGKVKQLVRSFTGPPRLLHQPLLQPTQGQTRLQSSPGVQQQLVPPAAATAGAAAPPAGTPPAVAGSAATRVVRPSPSPSGAAERTPAAAAASPASPGAAAGAAVRSVSPRAARAKWGQASPGATGAGAGAGAGAGGGSVSPVSPGAAGGHGSVLERLKWLEWQVHTMQQAVSGGPTESAGMLPAATPGVVSGVSGVSEVGSGGKRKRVLAPGAMQGGEGDEDQGITRAAFMGEGQEREMGKEEAKEGGMFGGMVSGGERGGMGEEEGAAVPLVVVAREIEERGSILDRIAHLETTLNALAASGIPVPGKPAPATLVPPGTGGAPEAVPEAAPGAPGKAAEKALAAHAAEAAMARAPEGERAEETAEVAAAAAAGAVRAVQGMGGGEGGGEQGGEAGMKPTIEPSPEAAKVSEEGEGEAGKKHRRRYRRKKRPERAEGKSRCKIM
ncbi:unnamed protein product [Closterium sp. NIES-65]|nr:unnamed protein product [Closterium sp. NIES-65]